MGWLLTKDSLNSSFLSVASAENHADRFASEILICKLGSTIVPGLSSLGSDTDCYLCTPGAFSPPFPGSETPSQSLPSLCLLVHPSIAVLWMMSHRCTSVACSLATQKFTEVPGFVLSCSQLMNCRLHGVKKRRGTQGPHWPIGVAYLQVAHRKISQQEKV